MDPWIEELVYLRAALLSHGKVVGMEVLANMSPSEREALKGWIVRQGASGTERTEKTEKTGGLLVPPDDTEKTEKTENTEEDRGRQRRLKQ